MPFLTILLLFFIFHDARAGVADPLTGVRISVLATQTVLAAPPLPSLETTKHGELAVQGSYISANVNDSQVLKATQGPDFTVYTTGQFRGGATGLGYTTPTRSDFGFFIFGTYNYLTGNIQMAVPGSPTFAISDMHNQGISGASGLSWRLWKSNYHLFALGIFFGPTASLFNSKFTVQGTNYNSSPNAFGAMAGAQMEFKILGISFNPYAIYYQDFSDGCKKFSADNADVIDINSTCKEGQNYLNLPLSFAAYGMNAGFGDFTIGVYSHVKKDSTLNAINLENYQLSYSFGL